MLRIWTLFTQFSLPTNWWQRSAIQIDKDNKNEKFAEAQVLDIGFKLKRASILNSYGPSALMKISSIFTDFRDR